MPRPLTYPEHALAFKGYCPLCQREMYDLRGSIDRHHLVPKSKGGVATEYLHRVCHTKIHSLFTESQCAKEFNTVEALLAHEEVAKFVKWVAKKEPLFKDRNISSANKGVRTFK